MRWEYYWRNLTNEEGYIIPSEQFWNAWRQKIKLRLAEIVRAEHCLQVIGNLLDHLHIQIQVRGLGQGRVNIIHVDPSNPNTIYLGSPAGGIWKSTNNGTTWTPLTDELPQIGVSGIAVDYSNSNTIYIATGDKDAGERIQ